MNTSPRPTETLDTIISLDFFRALSEPSRIALLDALLREGGSANVSTLSSRVNIDTSVASRHLKELARAGVLTVERRGRERWYGLDVSACLAQLDQVRGFLERASQGLPCC